MTTVKIAYNACYGGFGLSKEAVERYCEIKGWTIEPSANKWTRKITDKYGERVSFYAGDLKRDDPVLIQVIEELGDKADGRFAELRLIEVEAGTLYRIDEYDGREDVILAGSEEYKNGFYRLAGVHVLRNPSDCALQ